MPETYKEILGIIRKHTDVSYFDDADTIDWYVEQVIRLEFNRRRYGIPVIALQRWLKDLLWTHPLVMDTDPTTAISIINGIAESQVMWSTVCEELPVTPYTDPLLWHKGGGVWKMLTLRHEICSSTTS